MREVLTELLHWWSAGQTVGLATVTGTFRSAPRPPGAAMLVGPDATAVGSVSGGCVEGAVYELAQAVVASGGPVPQRYGVSDDDAFTVGLTCGGIIDLFPPTLEHPVRIDFFGDTVEEIRPFAVADQRSLDETLDAVTADPCREMLLTDEVRRRAAEHAERAGVPQQLRDLFTRIADLFPGAPFFYLSTSPWNVESSIRNFITDHGFPEGPLLLRDLDPRPKTFVPTGPQHKLEFAEQLMADFPDMKFILVGDDGQKDPTTYATIARRYPGRVLAIVIRELSPRESTGLASVTGLTSTQPTPVTDVPVFTGTTGSNILKTMLPYLKTVLR